MTHSTDAFPTTTDAPRRTKSTRSGRRHALVSGTLHRAMSERRTHTTRLYTHTFRSVAYCSPKLSRTERETKAIQCPSRRQRRYPSQSSHISRNDECEGVGDSDSGIAAGWALKWDNGNPTLLRHKWHSEPVILCCTGFVVALSDADSV